MNRWVQVNKLLKLRHIEIRRLGDELAMRRESTQALLQEKEAIAREIEQAEEQYRQVFQGEMTAFDLKRIADVRAWIAYRENRKIDVDRCLQEVEREVDELIEEVQRRHSIFRNYEELAGQLLRKEKNRRARRFENQCDELGLIRWSRYEGR